MRSRLFIAIVACVILFFGSPAIVQARSFLKVGPLETHKTIKHKKNGKNVLKQLEGYLLLLNQRRAVQEKPAPAPQLLYGRASWYALDGNYMANGQVMDSRQHVAAYMRAPFGTQLRVTNVATGANTIVTVTDRGGFEPLGRIIDLSSGAYASIAPLSSGVVNVSIEQL